MSDSQTQDLAVRQQPQEMRLAGPRLPFHPAMEERFGIDRGTWKVLTDVIFPAAEAPESIVMALSYCRARNLDILKKPVHIVPVWDKKRGKMVDSVWPAISESRITAMRTGEYAGKDETLFGPEVTKTLGGVDVTFPEWAMVTVYRFIKGERCPFAGEKVRWLEYYAKAKRDNPAPNDMWKTKTYSQISKCAEASALRTAFPEEVPSEGTAEEMEGQEVATVHTGESVTGPGVMARLSGGQEGNGFNHAQVIEQTEPTPPKTRKPRATKEAAQLPPHNPQTGEVIEGETVKGTDNTAEEINAIRAIEGPAPAGTVYILSGVDAVDGRWPTFRDGALFSSTTDAAKFPCYDEHPPEAEQQSGPTETDGAPAAEPEPDTSATATPASGDGREATSPSEAQGSGQDDAPPPLAPDIQAYADAVKSAADFQTVKAALATLQKTETWKKMSNEAADEVRFNTWDIMVATGVADTLVVSEDVSAFRLWIEWMEDPELIEAELSKLEDNAEFKGKTDSLKENIRGATKKRLEALAP